MLTVDFIDPGFNANRFFFPVSVLVTTACVPPGVTVVVMGPGA